MVAPRVATLWVACVVAAGPRPPIRPAFSWKTLPVAFHSSTSGAALSDAQARDMARYAMVTIEKYHNLPAVVPQRTLAVPYLDLAGLYACQNGTDLSRCAKKDAAAEDQMVAAAQKVKALNPDVVTIAYLHTEISHGWYRLAREVAANPSWWLAGGAKHIGPSESTWKNLDLTVSAAAAAWQRTAMGLAATGAIDGIFADGCTGNVSGVSPARVAALYAAKREMLRGLQAQLPGPVVCGSSAHGGFMSGVDAVMAEGWGVVRNGRTHFATEEIPMLMEAAAAGIIFQAHGRAVCGQSGERPDCCAFAGCCCNCATPQPDYHEPAVQTELAAFLVAMGERSYYVCGSWEDTYSPGAAPTTWMDVYDLPLGEPLGNATLVDGVWRRSFASGTNATFDTKSERGRIEWAVG